MIKFERCFSRLTWFKVVTSSSNLLDGLSRLWCKSTQLEHFFVVCLDWIKFVVIIFRLFSKWFTHNVVLELRVDMVWVAWDFATSWHMLVERNDFSKGVLHLHFSIEGSSHKPFIAKIAFRSRKLCGWRLQINLTIVQRMLFPLLWNVWSVENAARESIVFGINCTRLSCVTSSRKNLFLAIVSENTIRSLLLDVLNNLLIFSSFLSLFFER